MEKGAAFYYANKEQLRAEKEIRKRLLEMKMEEDEKKRRELAKLTHITAIFNPKELKKRTYYLLSHLPEFRFVLVKSGERKFKET